MKCWWMKNEMECEWRVNQAESSSKVSVRIITQTSLRLYLKSLPKIIEIIKKDWLSLSSLLR